MATTTLAATLNTPLSEHRPATMDRILVIADDSALRKALWTIHPDWGRGTDDSEQALSYVKRFGSVTVLNGHIHQIMQKIEGKVSFHTAMSTAFPQPAPGTAPSAGPMKVPADQLQRVLGITGVNYLVSGSSLAIVDSPLGDSSSSASGSGLVVVDPLFG